jgi:hypothetical protein
MLGRGGAGVNEVMLVIEGKKENTVGEDKCVLTKLKICREEKDLAKLKLIE